MNLRDHLLPIGNRALIGCSKVVLSTETGVFVDTKGKRGTLSTKKGVFVDKMMILRLLSMKSAVFVDKMVILRLLSMKSAVFMDKMMIGREGQTKKRHPRKDVSISGVEQGGTVEKPWPPVAS